MNLKELLSSRDVVAPYLDLILSKREVADAQVQMVEDWLAGKCQSAINNKKGVVVTNLCFIGLSLSTLNVRMDDLEARVEALNSKVAETCANFDDVKAYVDANIAEMKDFVGEIAKKLPSPKRLEVVGRMRKTLLLHFECVHTGREYPIESKGTLFIVVCLLLKNGS